MVNQVVIIAGERRTLKNNWINPKALAQLMEEQY